MENATIEWEVEAILEKRLHNGEFLYKIKWTNSNETAWGPRRILTNCAELLKIFNEIRQPFGHVQECDLRKFKGKCPIPDLDLIHPVWIPFRCVFPPTLHIQARQQDGDQSRSACICDL